MSNGIGKVGMNQFRDSFSLWRIYLPTDVDRDKYVKTCYMTGTVSLVNENSEFKHSVKIGRLSLQVITFPADTKSFGSEVICASMPYSGRLYVVDVFSSSSEIYDQEENQYRFFKVGKGYAEARIDGSGKILLTVDSDDAAEVEISVTNKDRSGSLKVNVNGEIMVINDGKTTVQSSQEINLEQYDAEADERTVVNIIKDQVKVISKKILLNDGEEPILLGNKTVDLLTKLLDFLGAESAGPYPLLGNVNYTNLKSDLEALKSELSFLK